MSLQMILQAEHKLTFLWRPSDLSQEREPLKYHTTFSTLCIRDWSAPFLLFVTKMLKVTKSLIPPLKAPEWFISASSCQSDFQCLNMQCAASKCIFTFSFSSSVSSLRSMGRAEQHHIIANWTFCYANSWRRRQTSVIPRKVAGAGGLSLATGVENLTGVLAGFFTAL